jgi:hypothetical protein
MSNHPDDPFTIATENFAAVGMRPGPVTTVSVAPALLSNSADNSPYIWQCATCGTHLNQMTHGDGTSSWLHARTWQRYDHEPDPRQVPREQRQDMLCDFCGLDTQMQWAFVGDVVTQHSGNGGSNYGHIWSACATCSPLVDARDLDALADRVLRVSHLARNRDAHVRAAIRESIHTLHEQFLATITHKQYLGPPIIPTTLTPRLLPKVRERLARHWRDPALYDRLGTKGLNISLPAYDPTGDDTAFRIPYTGGTNPTPHHFQHHAHHLATGIDAADLYWISEDFTALAVIAGQDLTDITLDPDDLPSRHGLIVWARPIGEIQRPHGTANIRAISWTPVPNGIWLNVYIQPEDGDPEHDITQLRADHGYLIAVNVGSGLPWGHLGNVDSEFKDTGNFVLTLLATWLLMRQPGVAEHSTAPADKKLARTYQRANKTLPTVRLIDLRRHGSTRTTTITDADGTRRQITVRFMVRGHWRNQAYGPKKGLRRQMYIAPFLKGPDDAPLKDDVATVKVLR